MSIKSIKSTVACCAIFCAAVFASFLSGAADLPVTVGLKFRADASVGVTTDANGAVTTWADQSPSGKDLTSSGNRPVLRETEYGPAVSFNGWNYIQTTANFINYAKHTVIVVAKPSKSYSTDANRPGDMFASNIAGNQNYDKNKDILLLCNWDQGKMLRASVYGSGANRSAYSTHGNSTDLVIFEQNFDGSTLTALVNGTDRGTLAVTDFNPTANAGVNLGGRPGLAGKLFYGDIYEVLVYDRAITDDDRKTLNRYLGTKWQVPGYVDIDPLEVTDGLRFRLDASAAGNIVTNGSGDVLSYSDYTHDDMLKLAPGTEANCPQYREVEGVKSLYFDGSDYIRSAVTPIRYGMHDIFIAIKPASTDTMGDLFLGDLDGKYVNGGVMMMCNWDANTILRACIWNGANKTTIPARARTTDAVILEQRYDGQTLYGCVNGATESSVAVSGFSQNGGVNIGGRPDYANGQLFKGDVYETLVFDRALTKIERYRILKHLYEKWGVEDAFKATIDAEIAEFDGRTAMRAKCPVADGLQFWCAADAAWSIVTNGDGNVTSWKDASSNEYSVATQGGCTAPAYQPAGYFLDRPCVRLTGGTCGLYGAQGKICYSNHTVFAVAQPGALACGEDMFGSYINSSGVKAGGILMIANKNSHSMRAFYSNGSAHTQTSEYDLGAARTNHTLYMQRFDDAKLTAKVSYLDGANGLKTETASANRNGVQSAAKTDVSLGGRFTNNYGWNGSFAEIMVYDRALTEAEVAAVETYLRNKWFSNDFTVTVQDDGMPTRVTISDTTALSAGTVTLTGDVRELEAGSYDIVTAAGISAGQTWTLVVEQPSKKRMISLVAQDGKLVLNVAKSGMVLIFR